MKLQEIWPNPFRALNAECVRSLSEEDFQHLCTLVYRRAKRHSKSDKQAKMLVRRLIQRRRGQNAAILSRRFSSMSFNMQEVESNTILDALVPNRSRQWLVMDSRRDKFQHSLKGFSFVDFPEETIDQLRRIAKAECTARHGRLDFGDPLILDIGPYVVLGLMRRGMAPFLRGGAMTYQVRKVIEAVRLREFMGIRPFLGLSDIKDVWAFPLMERVGGRHSTEPSKSVKFSLAADKFVDTVNEWLGALPIPMALTAIACAHLSRIVTEILENAERHGRSGSETGDWHMAGFMARRECQYGGDTYLCHIAIVNTGVAIADNFRDISSNKLQDDIRKYVSKHRNRSGQSEATLSTLLAMQDGVSSLPNIRGGLGMMEVVEMANRLGTTNDPEHRPSVTIISGRSCIRFADEFCGFHHRNGGRMQLFNDQRSVDFPPDRNYVFDMQHGFPGTIVAMRFSLDCDAQMQKIGSND